MPSTYCFAKNYVQKGNRIFLWNHFEANEKWKVSPLNCLKYFSIRDINTLLREEKILPQFFMKICLIYE